LRLFIRTPHHWVRNTGRAWLSQLNLNHSSLAGPWPSGTHN
jgi:hypothetical protein